jgi:hypothetical protein
VGGGATNLRRLVRVLGWVEMALPHPAPRQQRLFEEFKATERAAPDEVLKNPSPTEEERLARARFRWLALESLRAANECAPLLLHRGALEPEAALLTIDCHLAEGERDKAIQLFESVIARHRDRRDLVARGATLLLDLDDSRGAQLAGEVFERCDPDVGTVGLHWAMHHVRHRRWDQAETVLDRMEAAVTPMPSDLAEEVRSLRAEIAACKASPATFFKRHHLPRALAVVLVWAVPAGLLFLAAWVAWQIGPVFLHEGQTLRRLQEGGVQVDSAHVRDVARHDLRDSMLSELTYVFAPDLEQAESWERPLPTNYTPEAIEAWLAAVRAGELPRGWYRGQTIVFQRTAQAIEEDPALQRITYLPADPTVNTIGPITWIRIWLTWSGGGKSVLFAVIILGTAVYFAGQALIKRVTRSAIARRPP